MVLCKDPDTVAMNKACESYEQVQYWVKWIHIGELSEATSGGVSPRNDTATRQNASTNPITNGKPAHQTSGNECTRKSGTKSSKARNSKAEIRDSNVKGSETNNSKPKNAQARNTKTINSKNDDSKASGTKTRSSKRNSTDKTTFSDYSSRASVSSSSTINSRRSSFSSVDSAARSNYTDEGPDFYGGRQRLGESSSEKDKGNAPRGSKKRTSDAHEDSRSEESRPSKQRRTSRKEVEKSQEDTPPESDTIVVDAPALATPGSETDTMPEPSDSDMSDAAEPEGEVWKRYELRELAQPPKSLLNRKMEL